VSAGGSRPTPASMTVPHVHLGFIWNAMYLHGRGPALARFTMKTPLLLVLTAVVLGYRQRPGGHEQQL
jgi:hypothetical protein